MNLSTQIEAILFWKGEPIEKKKLESMLKVSFDELETGLNELEKSLTGRGIRLIRTETELELRTAPEMSDMITAFTKEELVKDLGKAGLETLSIILYRAPVKRNDIDYIRGVNSSFIIRNLLVRGLIERVTEREGSGRGFAYKPTIDLLAHLGVSKLEELPDYLKVQAEMKAFAEEAEKEKTEPPHVA